MNTTNLFVELVVIGVGVLIWLLLLVITVLGYEWLFISNNTLLIGSALPALALIYVLGIIWDRIADTLFHMIWADDLRESYFVDISNYYNSRRAIITKSQPLSVLLEYGRSRLRICRGWSLNALMIGVSLNMMLWNRFSGHEDLLMLSFTGSFVSLILAAGSWFAWRSLSTAEYRKIKEQSEYLINEEKSDIKQ